MTNLTPETLQNYLKKLQDQYSESSYNRKLSSLRRFVQFLKEKGKVDRKRARELTDILSTQIPQIATDQTDRDTAASPWPSQKERPTPDRVEQARPLQRENVVAQLAEPKNNETMEQWNNEKVVTNYLKKHRSSTITIALMIFLAFSLNIYLFSKMNSNLLERIDAAVTRTESSDEVKDLVLNPADITLTLTIDATLTDNFGIPLSYEQDINFAIYPTRTTTSPIYTTGLCQVEPNDSGRISVDLGLDCGQPMPYSLLKQYPELYLGMSIGFGSELQPRFALKKLELLSGLTTPTSPPTKGEPTPTPLPLFSFPTSHLPNPTDSSTTN